MKKIILLFGPTASGKSKLAIDLAQNYNGEIVNADSMQVYSEIKILSARPDEKHVKHHLYGCVSVNDNFSVGKWYTLATNKIKEINKKNKVAIVVGGTGLYFKVLIDGLIDIPEIPKIEMNLNPLGRHMMINSYSNKYPGIFDHLDDLNDTQRLYRAIAVYDHTGMTVSEWHTKENKKNFQTNEFIKVCLIPEKKEIENRIQKRFDDMLNNGAVEEAKNFYKLDIWKKSLHTANSIIGLREIHLYLSKKISLDELKNDVLVRTRQYAKRQYTWQRGQMKDWKAFDDINYLDLQKKVSSYISKT